METTRRVTPTGQLILSADAPRETWLASRRDGITATDLPAILGLSKYKTAIDVWMEKISDSSDAFEPAIGEKEAALWGIVLEDTVARTWAEHAGVTVRRVGIICHEDHAWMRASLDRLVNGCSRGRCGLEVKTRSGYVGDEWDKGVPADVVAQVRWQLIVSGLDHIHVIALIGGQRLVEHTITLEDANVPEIIGYASTVWNAVQAGEAPQLPEAVWTDDYLDQLHPDRTGEVEVDRTTEFLVNDYQRVITEISVLEDTKAEIRTQLIGALGEHETATSDGRTLYSYKSSTRKSLDQKALAELHSDAIADDRIWKTTTSRTLRLATTKKESN